MNKLITIIIPAFREGSNIDSIYQRLNSVTRELSLYSWNFLFINDGSGDDSFERIRDISLTDSRVRGLDFSKNFGKEAALYAGVIESPETDAVICIDADLQHPPELIPQLILEWESGADIVAAIRRTSEKKTLIRKLFSKMFYLLMRAMTSVDLANNSTDFRLYDKKVLDCLRRVTGQIYMFRATMDWFGFRTAYITFDAPERLNGEAAYSFGKLWNLAVGSITSFSLFPLKIVGYLGLLVILISTPLFIWILINYTFHTSFGYTPLALVVVLNTLFMGVTLFAIGLVALYIGAIHTETAKRPIYIVREKIN